MKGGRNSEDVCVRLIFEGRIEIERVASDEKLCSSKGCAGYLVDVTVTPDENIAVVEHRWVENVCYMGQNRG